MLLPQRTTLTRSPRGGKGKKLTHNNYKFSFLKVIAVIWIKIRFNNLEMPLEMT